MSIRKTGQEGLLLWLQSRTSGYKGVNVVDFTKSWENGLAFCALIHSFHPDLIPFDTLKPEDKAGNLKLAFDTADKLGVPALMDPEDMLMDCGPDKFSVVTYVSQYYHKFKNIDNKDGSDEVQIKAPVQIREDELAARRQKIEQERMMQKKCAKCTLGFANGGTIIDALGKQYHNDCFVCFSCSKPFKDHRFVNVDGNPYCPTCAKDKFTSKTIAPVEEDNPPCHKCKRLCEGDTVNALGHSWHPECFMCTTCNKLFQAGVAKVLNVDGMPYCEQCGRRAFVSRRTVASPTPQGGGLAGGGALSKSKSMGAIPKMMEMASDSPGAKPLLGGSNLSTNLSSRLQAFQKPAEDTPQKKPEIGRLGSSSAIFADRAQRRLEEDERKKKEEEEKVLKKQEEERLKEDARKKKEEEKHKKKLEEEEKKRKEQEEKEARKKEEEEAKKRRAEEVKKRKAEEEERKKKEAEEEEAKKREKHEQIKRARSESSARKLELEEIKKKEEEEKKRREAEEEERKKEALRKKREELRGRAQEEEKKKEEATSKRTSIRVLHRSITETFVRHDKLADVSSSSTHTVLSPSNTPRDISTPRDATTPRDAVTPRDTSSTPRDTFATPRDTSATPRDTSATPRDTFVTPRDTSATPRDTSSTPRESATPRETSFVPARETLAQRDSPSPSLREPIGRRESVRDIAAHRDAAAQREPVHTLIMPRAISPTPAHAAAHSLSSVSAPAHVSLTPTSPLTLSPSTSFPSRSASPSPPLSTTLSSSASSSFPSPSLPSLSPSHSPASSPSLSHSVPYSPPLGPVTTATEKVVKLQSHSKIPCPAADVMCTWSSTSDNTVQSHVASCPFFLLRPILLKLKQNNEDLQKKVDQLQIQQEKDHELLLSLQQAINK